MSEKPLTPWVVCENSGKVLSAHCDCMAGLGESCSHVASLLWAIEAGCKRRDSLTVTDKKAYWVLPTSVKTVPYARVKDINFSKTPSSTSTVKPSSVTPPSETELTNFLNCIKDCPSKPALLSLVPAHSDSYVPKSVNPELPVVLSSLFDNSLSNADYWKNQKKHLNYSRWPKSSRNWWRKRPVNRQAPGFGFVWGQGGSLPQNSRMPVTPIMHVHNIHWLWVFATLKWHVLILRQPNGVVIMRRQRGMPTADTKKRSM